MSGQEGEKPQEDTEWGAGRRRVKGKRESKRGREGKEKEERRRREGKEGGRKGDKRIGGNSLMYSTAYINYIRDG